jgi:hypothetical protein
MSRNGVVAIAARPTGSVPPIVGVVEHDKRDLDAAVGLEPGASWLPATVMRTTNPSLFRGGKPTPGNRFIVPTSLSQDESPEP